MSENGSNQDLSEGLRQSANQFFKDQIYQKQSTKIHQDNKYYDLNENQLKAKFDELFFQSIYDEAWKVCQILKPMVEGKPEYINYFEPIESKMKEIHFLDNIIRLDNKEGWINEKSQNMDIWYHKDPITQNYTVSMETEVICPLLQICAIIYEIDLFTEWLPFCYQSKDLKQVTLTEKIAFFNLDLPFLAKREALVKGYGVNRLDLNQSIMIVAKSIQDDKEYLAKNVFEMPQNKSQTVQVQIEYLLFQMTVLDNQKIKVKQILSVNPKIAFIPQFVLNYIIKTVSPLILNRMIQKALNIKGSIHEIAMKDAKNEQFYKWIKIILDDFFSKSEQKLVQKL